MENPQQTAGSLYKSSDLCRGDPVVIRPRKSGRPSARKSPDPLNILPISKRSSEENIHVHEISGFRDGFVEISRSAVLSVISLNL
jgi:hypothetical protein